MAESSLIFPIEYAKKLNIKIASNVINHSLKVEL